MYFPTWMRQSFSVHFFELHLSILSSFMLINACLRGLNLWLCNFHSCTMWASAPGGGTGCYLEHRGILWRVQPRTPPASRSALNSVCVRDFYLAFLIKAICPARHEHRDWDWKRCATLCDPWEMKRQRQPWRSGPQMYVRCMNQCWQLLDVKSSTGTTAKPVDLGQAKSSEILNGAAWGMLQITPWAWGHDMLRFGQGWQKAVLGLGLSRTPMCVTAEDRGLIDHPYATCMCVELTSLL